MKIDISFDDGHQLDLRTMDLLKKHDLTAIFFIPILSWGFSNLKRYKGFQVGCHTFSHPMDLKQLSDDELRFEVVDSKRMLEKEWGSTLEWFCPPRGRGDERVKKQVLDAGFDRYRTTLVGCTSYDECFTVNTTVHMCPRGEYGDVGVVEYARKCMDEAKKNPRGYFHLWGHSQEIYQLNYWAELEEILIMIKNEL